MEDLHLSKETNQILEEIRQKGPIRVSELLENFGISSKTAHKHLKILQNKRLISKQGTVPEVYYSIYVESNPIAVITTKDDLLIENNYIYLSPSGKFKKGLEGFEDWCNRNNFNINKEKQQYVKTFKKMKKFSKDGLIKSKNRILSGKYEVDLDQVFFNDFYTIGHFGKTKLGQLIYIAKTSQNISLVLDIVKIIKPAIDNIIENYDIKYIGYIPPTVDRKIQIMDLLKESLKLEKKIIEISKLPSSTKVAQKTLRKLEDRIENAQDTIVVKPTQSIDGNVLLIDDATGSGATLNEVSKKIRKLSTKKIKIIGYTVVGSYKGFDVISEV